METRFFLFHYYNSIVGNQCRDHQYSIWTLKNSQYVWIKEYRVFHIARYSNNEWNTSLPFGSENWRSKYQLYIFFETKNICHLTSSCRSSIVEIFNDILFHFFSNDTNNLNLKFRNQLWIILKDLVSLMNKKKIDQRCQIIWSWWTINIIVSAYYSSRKLLSQLCHLRRSWFLLKPNVP